MKVFVLAPIHNRKEITLNFIRSFANQTYPEYQMVIIDDGSTDSSSEAILAEFPKTIILKGDGNLWWTGSMRKGVDYVLSIAQNDDYILAINDDVIVGADYIEKLVSISKENGDSIVGSIYRNIEKRDKTYDCGVKIDWRKYQYYQASYNKEKKFSDNVDVLSTRGTIMPIGVVKKMGNFEKKLKHYAADYEYFLRAKKAGYKLMVSYDAVVYGSEKDKVIKNLSGIQSFADVWKRNFSIKSPANILNHLFLIWHYCPSLIYKIKHTVIFIGYNSVLFLISILLYPFKYLFFKLSKTMFSK